MQGIYSGAGEWLHHSVPAGSSGLTVTRVSLLENIVSTSTYNTQHTQHGLQKIYLNRVYDNPYFGVSKVVRISKSSILRKWFHLKKSHGHTRFNISCWNSNICLWSLEVKTPPLSNLVQVPFMSLYNNI